MVFTSAGNKANNVNVLQEYVYHRLYSYDLHQPAKLVRSESESYDIYVPRWAPTALFGLTGADAGAGLAAGTTRRCC